MKYLLPVLVASCLFAQQQPVPFSHKQHAGDLKLKCAECHPNPDPGAAMTFPKPEVCGRCHAGKYDQPIDWVRIYRVPDFVFFGHRTHVTAGTACETCHGPVAERAVIRHEIDLGMAACMNCHRDKKVSVDCTFCHDQR